MAKEPEVCSVRNTSVIQQKLFHDVQWMCSNVGLCDRFIFREVVRIINQ